MQNPQRRRPAIWRHDRVDQRASDTGRFDHIVGARTRCGSFHHWSFSPRVNRIAEPGAVTGMWSSQPARSPGWLW